MTEDTDWQALIQKHLDGLTSDAEATSLSDQIVNDAKVRSDYLMAAKVHGGLGDETLALALERIPFTNPEPKKKPALRPSPRPQQLTAALAAGALVGLLGIGVVWAVNAPRSEAGFVPIANGDFENSVGPIEIGFPAKFGHWAGDPAQVIEEESGNRILRFLETANVTGNPDGGASACNVFQLIDLASLQQEWDLKNSESQVTLELSARFRREAAPTDSELPKLKGTCTIHLYQADPGSIGKGWPDVIRDAVAIGNKTVKLKPGDDSATISASCILEPEATIALISVNVGTGIPTTTPIKLGGYYADDIRLTLTKRPNLPIRIVK